MPTTMPMWTQMIHQTVHPSTNQLKATIKSTPVPVPMPTMILMPMLSQQQSWIRLLIALLQANFWGQNNYLFQQPICTLVKDLLIVSPQPQAHVWKYLLPRITLLLDRCTGLLYNHRQTFSPGKTKYCCHASSTSKGEMIQHLSKLPIKTVGVFILSTSMLNDKITCTCVCDGMWEYSTHCWAPF
jgi:hypothetical protein